MPSPHRIPQDPTPHGAHTRHPLDPWIDQMGEDYFVDLAASTRRGVANGTIPTFSDMGLLLEHVNNRIAG